MTSSLSHWQVPLPEHSFLAPSPPAFPKGHSLSHWQYLRKFVVTADVHRHIPQYIAPAHKLLIALAPPAEAGAPALADLGGGGGGTAAVFVSPRSVAVALLRQVRGGLPRGQVQRALAGPPAVGLGALATAAVHGADARAEARVAFLSRKIGDDKGGPRSGLKKNQQTSRPHWHFSQWTSASRAASSKPANLILTVLGVVRLSLPRQAPSPMVNRAWKL